jgi:hypothetical protein
LGKKRLLTSIPASFSPIKRLDKIACNCSTSYNIYLAAMQQIQFWRAAMLLILLCATQVAKAQLAGCTDPLATNYTAAATINNGSCQYAPISYTPVVKVNPLKDSLMETSGLQWAEGGLWTINDGGNAPVLYKIDSLSQQILQRVIFSSIRNIDWEDLAFDGTHLYIGDFGNNQNGARQNLKIYKIPISDIPPHGSHPIYSFPAALIDSIGFWYSDQPQPPVPVTTASQIQYDCEAMLADSGQLHLFTKNWSNLSTSHYIIPTVQPGNYPAQLVETLPAGFLVTAADKSAYQNIIVLLGYQNTGAADHFLYLLSHYSNGLYFNGNKRKINLPNATIMGQAEGICFSTDSTGYISNERFTNTVGPFTINVAPQLKGFNLGSWVSGFASNYIFTGQGNWSAASNWRYQMLPPAILPAKANIIINPVATGACTLDVDYHLQPGTQLLINPGKQLIIPGAIAIQQ